MKIVTVVGARPQFIKAAMIAREIADRPDGIDHTLIHTGQHFDDNMSDIFFRQMGIPRPDVTLGIGGGPHGEMTGRMLQAVEPVLMSEKPDWVLVYGDTNSTLAGALAAAKLHLPVAHVEAGLRSFNRRMPEEINRVVADHLANLLLVPTQAAIDNLRDEGISGEKVRLVGDVMFDAVRVFSDVARRESTIVRTLGLKDRCYVLATIHRAENTDDPRKLQALFDGLAAISRELPVVLPLHPRTRNALAARGVFTPPSPAAGNRTGSERATGLQLIDPVGYLDMLALEASAAVICTDSGGVQKEAFFQGVPCITLRGETEWVELVEIGANLLVHEATAASMLNALRTMRSKAVPRRADLYGDGHAATKIIDALTMPVPVT
jgi:UDP-GlcNAc3NAcA epimerase